MGDLLSGVVNIKLLPYHKVSPMSHNKITLFPSPLANRGLITYNKAHLGETNLADKCFRFYKCFHLVQATGQKAKNLKELLKAVAEAEPEVIFYHLYQAFSKYTISVPEFPSDFAAWASQQLQDRALAEKLANIDLYSFADLELLRSELVRIMETHLMETPGERAVIPGEEFYFNQAISLISLTDYQVSDLEEFAQVLRQIDTNLIYYHFFEARLRLGMCCDDFSHWMDTSLARQALAQRIKGIDPYQLSLEEIRSRILSGVEEEIGTKL